MQNFCYDSAIWAQTDATHKAAPTNEWVGGLLLQSLSYTAVYLSPSERVRTLVLILTERSTESVGRVFRMEVGPGGLDLTPFARQVYKHPDVEVHFVQINVMLARGSSRCDWLLLVSQGLQSRMVHALVYRKCN